MSRVYGWKRDAIDPRDWRWTATAKQVAALPPRISLRDKFPQVYDQGALGSCVYNAIPGVLEYDQRVQGHLPATPSRLFGYYNARSLEGTVDSDAGCSIRSGIKATAKFGFVSERLWWPYDIARFREKPPEGAYSAARPNAITDYAGVTQTSTGEQIKAAIAAGNPVIFGFACGESIDSAETARTGLIQLPKRGERIVGGHAVVAIGYDDGTGLMEIRNSWGVDWGQQGYGWMPYPYIFSYLWSADFWVINTIPGAPPEPVPPPAPVPSKRRVSFEYDEQGKFVQVA